MDQPLVERVLDWLSAGLAGDTAALDAACAPDFESIRCDEAGRVVKLTRQELLSGPHAPKRCAGERTGEIHLLTTSEYDGHEVALVRRAQQGTAVLHTFVWRAERG
ncbi:hypothetical protein [Streptomyces sp. cg36]|uniref:hypothetical protein n=1 Tax=Streptomyces sp. cg36 TaxID=3238798 RepID=UPI0034E2F424